MCTVLLLPGVNPIAVNKNIEYCKPSPRKNDGIMHDHGHCLKSLDYSSLLGIEVKHKKVHVLKLWNIVYVWKGSVVLKVQEVLVHL